MTQKRFETMSILKVRIICLLWQLPIDLSRIYYAQSDHQKVNSLNSIVGAAETDGAAKFRISQPLFQEMIWEIVCNASLMEDV